MLLTTTFFTGLDQIEIPPTSTRGERFADVYNLTTDKRKILEVVKPLSGSLGSVETSYLTEGGAKALAYRITQQEIDDADPQGALAELLIADMLRLRMLQLGFWLMKDNAVHFDRAWISAQTKVGLVVNNNTWEGRYSRADGTFQSVRFDEEELRTARAVGQAPAEYLDTMETPTMLTSRSFRFQRFEYFVDAARKSFDVAMKVAQYCSALEALVSTAQVELSHQVSERVAAILTEPGEERIFLFKHVKEAYGYRSKAVHGSSFRQKDADRLRDCSTRLDEVCRQLAIAYFNPASGLKEAIDGSDDQVTEFFVQRTLGGSSA